MPPPPAQPRPCSLLFRHGMTGARKPPGKHGAGKRQAKVELPALWLSVTAQEVAEEPSLPELLGAAADGGATAVVLRDGACLRVTHLLLRQTPLQTSTSWASAQPRGLATYMQCARIQAPFVALLHHCPPEVPVGTLAAAAAPSCISENVRSG